MILRCPFSAEKQEAFLLKMTLIYMLA